MTFDIGEETCSSLDGNEGPHHNRHKLQKRGMKRKERDSEPGSSEGSQESRGGVEQGHEWNDQFGFKIERPAKAHHEWMHGEGQCEQCALVFFGPCSFSADVQRQKLQGSD